MATTLKLQALKLHASGFVVGVCELQGGTCRLP